jgi:hypothetical protein
VNIEQALAVIGILASLGRGPLAAQGRRFTLSGTVVDGVGSQPMPGVEVSLQTEKWKAVSDSAVSDAQGRFAFTGLPAGEYILSAEVSGFGTVRYGEAPDPGWVGAVRVAADKSLVFRIVPRGGIEGVVRDEFGDPMMGANVSILRPLWREGRTDMRNVGQKSTDDRGRYRFGNLAPGTYVVCASGNQNTIAPIPGPVDFTARVDNRIYSRTCNRQFQLAPGQHAQVDLSPLAAASATVRGRVRNATPQTGLSVFLVSDDPGLNQNFGGSVDLAQGTFAIRRVPPGHYRLHAQVHMYGPSADGAAKPLSADLPVDVGGSDVDGLDVVVDSGGVVDVVFHGLAENRIDPTSVSASLRSTDASAISFGAIKHENGEAHFEGVPPRSYRLNTSTEAGSCVESVKLGDREVRGATFDVAAGAALHLDVMVSKNCGSIEMRAVRDGEAVPGAKVVLLVSGTAKDPGQTIEDFANDEGAFSFAGLSPGRYLLWAWPVEGKDAMTGPASLAAAEQQATVIEVKAGDAVHADVPVLRNEAKGQ